MTDKGNQPKFVKTMIDKKEEIMLGVMSGKHPEKDEQGNNKTVAAQYTEELSNNIIGTVNSKLE